MKVKYYQLKDNSIVQVDQDQEIRTREWVEKLAWVDIQANTRKEVAEYFKKASLYEDAHDCIENPENYPVSSCFEKVTIFNIPKSNKDNIYEADYNSIIIDDNLIITIILQESDPFPQKVLSSYLGAGFLSFRTFLADISMSRILTQNNKNMGVARNHIETLELLLINNPDRLSSKELMSNDRNISHLSDIIEDQYIGFGILTSTIDRSNLNGEVSDQTAKLVKAFEPMDKAMQRLEKKAQSLRLQYSLIQQEISTQKINVLTIVQAVFVPLTFVAGIYGMNFINIPETKLAYGYLYVWVLFIGLAGGLLVFFKKNGWFD